MQCVLQSSTTNLTKPDRVTGSYLSGKWIDCAAGLFHAAGTEACGGPVLGITQRLLLNDGQHAALQVLMWVLINRKSCCKDV